MGIVHGETPNAQHPVQGTGPLVPIDVGDLRVAHWKIPIRALSIRVDEGVHGAVHGLDAVPHVIGLPLPRCHRRELMIRVDR